MFSVIRSGRNAFRRIYFGIVDRYWKICKLKFSVFEMMENGAAWRLFQTNQGSGVIVLTILNWKEHLV